MSEQFTDPEQSLIERLAKAPQPELSPEAREAIHARVLAAFENPPTPTPRPYLPRPIVVLIVVAVGALIAAGALYLITQPPAPVTPTLSATVLPTVVPATAIPATPIPAVINTDVPSVTSTDLPTLTVTAASTIPSTLASGTSTGLPAPMLIVTATTTVNTITVIEGPIQTINGNIVTIYDIPVQLAPNDPILPVIVVGDIVRVEGNTLTVDNQVVIVAIVVVVTSVDVNTEPSTGGVWRDDGNCANPPPDWAPANGWRRRCQGQDAKPNNGNGNRNSNGNGNDDDDDDD